MTAKLFHELNKGQKFRKIPSDLFEYVKTGDETYRGITPNGEDFMETRYIPEYATVYVAPWTQTSVVEEDEEDE